MKLNFLNFVAFPITFGNGVDYGVNLMRRYGIERDRGVGAVAAVRAAVEETGGAIVLCSLTTIIGYISLYTSANKALNSFGAAMAISEVTCVLAAVLALPALILLMSRRPQTAKASPPKGEVA
jgi:predicted RND superfamily exporter protein